MYESPNVAVPIATELETMNIETTNVVSKEPFKLTKCVGNSIIVFFFLILYGLKSAFPFYGQYHAYQILTNWTTYCDEEGKDLATYELICASYGIYGIYLLFKFTFSSAFNCAFGWYVQLNDDEIEELNKNNCVRHFIFTWGFGDKFYDKKINFCKKFVGFIMLSIITCFILTPILVLIDLFRFGKKFITQTESSYKYVLGHIYMIIATFGIHIVQFTITKFFSERIVDRILARSAFGITLVPYCIYCYFYYAINWRWNYQNEKAIIETSDLSAELKAKKLFTNDVCNVCGFFMLCFGTGFIYLIFYCGYILDIKLTEIEIYACVLTCGLYLIFKLIYEYYLWLFSSRKRYNNKENFTSVDTLFFIMIEALIFISTCGMDYIANTIHELVFMIPGSKRFKIATWKSLIFAPFILATDLNITIRLIAKLFLCGYNFIIAYCIIMYGFAENNNHQLAAIIILSVFSYPMHCVCNEILNNELLVDSFNKTKKCFRNTMLHARYVAYKLKTHFINTLSTYKNSFKIIWANFKSQFAKSKANFYNYVRGYQVGHPKFKVGRVYQPLGLSELRAIKTFNDYYQVKFELDRKKSIKHNILYIIKSFKAKCNYEYNLLTNVYTIYNCKLWCNRYDRFVQTNLIDNEIILTPDLFDRVQNSIVKYVNTLNQFDIDNDMRESDMLSIISFYHHLFDQLDKTTNLLCKLESNDLEHAMTLFLNKFDKSVCNYVSMV